MLGTRLPRNPPNLGRSGSPPWTAEYPQEFRDLLPQTAGHIFYPAGPDPVDARGFFVAAGKQYDFQTKTAATQRGLTIAQRDPLGRDTLIAYDSFDLLPVLVTDPAGLETTAAYDYRLLQPSQVTDPNGNQSLFAFTPLGMLDATWVRGAKPGEGDQKR